MTALFTHVSCTACSLYPICFLPQRQQPHIHKKSSFTNIFLVYIYTLLNVSLTRKPWCTVNFGNEQRHLMWLFVGVYFWFVKAFFFFYNRRTPTSDWVKRARAVWEPFLQDHQSKRGGALRCTFSNLALSPARQASRRGDTLRPSGPQGQHSLPFLSHLTDSLQGRYLLFLNSPSAAAGVVNLGAISGWYPAWWNPCPVARGCEGFTDVPAKGGRDLNVLDGGLHYFKVRCSYSLPPTENS